MRICSAATLLGDLTSRANVNTLCSNTATGFAVGKTIVGFVSFMGDSLVDFLTAHGVPASAPLKNRAGTATIATNWADAMDNTAAMSLSAAGVYNTGGFHWTFSEVNGVYDPTVNGNCNSGTANAAANGGVGWSTDATGIIRWAFAVCSSPRHLLCVAF